MLYNLMSENYNNTCRTLNIVDPYRKYIHDSNNIQPIDHLCGHTNGKRRCAHTALCIRRHVFDSLIMLITQWVAFKCVTCGCFWIFEKKIVPASCSCVTHFRQKPAEGRRSEASVEVLHQYHVMSLHVLTPWGAPWATLSHPSPYAFSHFTFIRTSKDFPEMKERRAQWVTCWGEVKSSSHDSNWTLLLENAMREMYSFHQGHTEVV